MEPKRLFILLNVHLITSHIDCSMKIYCFQLMCIACNLQILAWVEVNLIKKSARMQNEDKSLLNKSQFFIEVLSQCIVILMRSLQLETTIWKSIEIFIMGLKTDFIRGTQLKEINSLSYSKSSLRSSHFLLHKGIGTFEMVVERSEEMLPFISAGWVPANFSSDLCGG